MNDQTSVGMVFAKQPPKQRVLTLQLTNDTFVIPPGVPTTAWKCTARCPTMRRCSASSRTCTCAGSGSSTTSSTRRLERNAAARELQFLLAVELPAGASRAC